jgi:hypothetical protein
MQTFGSDYQNRAWPAGLEPSDATVLVTPCIVPAFRQRPLGEVAGTGPLVFGLIQMGRRTPSATRLSVLRV